MEYYIFGSITDSFICSAGSINDDITAYKLIHMDLTLIAGIFIARGSVCIIARIYTCMAWTYRQRDKVKNDQCIVSVCGLDQ